MNVNDPIIDLHSDDYFMGEALRQAAKAYEKGEVPVGAVIVREGRIIARAFNQVEQLKDATAHAEMLALTQAENAVGDWRLTGCTLYVTKEPCPHVRRSRGAYAAGPRGLRGGRSQGRRGGWRIEPAAISHAQSSLRNHLRRAAR
ncbi:MAG: nucleoside deaminase [Limisphaerales bacterium]